MTELLDEEDLLAQARRQKQFWIVAGVAVLLGLGALIWSYTLSRRLSSAEAAVAGSEQNNARLQTELDSTNARLRVATETLGRSVGLTQKQLETRATEIIRQQSSDAKRLEREQAKTAQDVGAVTTQVATVQTDVGGVKTEVAATKADLATTKTQLQSAIGDLGVHSGLIARNHDELEILKHKGDRTYYEFTLKKGDPKKPVGTISLELKKADANKSRYTMNVFADDKKIEKKDKGLNEPLQFYSGKDRGLFELVINTISKNQVTGYLSTPKNSPAPAAVP